MKTLTKKLLSLTATVAMAMSVNSCYDDSEMMDRLVNIQTRLDALELLCSQMNTNISSMQQMVNALRGNDYVTGVQPITENGKTIGYTITFANSQPVTIYNGKDGADGSSPVIGVKQDTDGLWYWTIDGKWMLDANNNKVRASCQDGTPGNDGTDGQDGVTPKLKIDEDYWYISYDNGTTWTKLVKATGENGTNGTSFFKSVTNKDNGVELVLADGTTITLPKSQPLGISFMPETSSAVGDGLSAGKTAKYSYEILTKASKVSLEFIATSDLAVSIEPSTEDPLKGTITVYAKSKTNTYSKITFFISDGTSLLISVINFKPVID